MTSPVVSLSIKLVTVVPLSKVSIKIFSHLGEAKEKAVLRVKIKTNLFLLNLIFSPSPSILLVSHGKTR